MRSALVACGLWLLLAAPVAAQQTSTTAVGAVADVKEASGKSVASAEFREDQGKVQVALTLPTPAPFTGKHAVHITSVGRCDPPDFSSAGPIFNPFGKKHGLLTSGGPMVGDLPNLNMPLQRYNAPALGATIAPGPASLLGPRGTALVIYAGEDDQVTDPEGKAGARIACGVIVAAGQTAAAAPATASQPVPPNNPGQTFGPALIIGVLGAVLIVGGVLLRRSPSTR